MIRTTDPHGVEKLHHSAGRHPSRTRGELRGQLTGDQQDLLRSAVVFISSGLDAWCQRLLRDALPVPVEANSAAEGKYIERMRTDLGAGRVNRSLADAICDPSPRPRLIEYCVDSLVGSSLQRTGDLKRVRDALGVSDSQLTDGQIDRLQDLFAARNRIVHQLDYEAVDGSGGRRTQVMGDVKAQCDEVISLVVDLIIQTARLTHSARRSPRTKPSGRMVDRGLRHIAACDCEELTPRCIQAPQVRRRAPPSLPLVATGSMPSQTSTACSFPPREATYGAGGSGAER